MEAFLEDAGEMFGKNNPVNAISLSQKLGLIVFGIFLSFFMLEMGLNLSGYLILISRAKHFKKICGSDNRILCLGDSFVFGIGSGRGEDFPSAFDKIINKNNGNKKIEVINAGIPGQNSSMLANRFEGNIKKYNPSLAIILIGVNDSHNHKETDLSFLLQHRKLRYFPAYYDLLQYSKTYRLMVILSQSMQNKFLRSEHKKEDKENYALPIRKKTHDKKEFYFQHAGFYYFDRREYGKAKLCFRNLLKINHLNMGAYLGLGKIYCDLQEFQEALYFLKKAEEISPNNPDILRQMLWTLKNLKKYDDCVNICLRILEIKGQDIDIYKELAVLMQQQNIKQEQIREVFNKIDGRLVNGLLSHNDDSIYKDILQRNIQKIAELAKAYGIKVILCTYPNDFYVNKCILDAGAKFNLKVIDVRRTFSDLLRACHYQDLFVRDGHCNSRGYEIMATVLSAEIERAISRNENISSSGII